jgi:hypothetical protein
MYGIRKYINMISMFGNLNIVFSGTPARTLSEYGNIVL